MVKTVKEVTKKLTKKSNKVLVLRTCNKDLTSHNDFKWKTKGVVTAPDWDPKPECGNGLHGLLWGQGNGDLLNWGPDAKWLVVEVDKGKVVNIGGKVKFPSGNVIYCGNRKEATDLLASKAPVDTVIVGYMATAGDKGTATAGYGGTAIAGDGGTATAGAWGTATAGYGGTASAGAGGTASAGTCGTASAGCKGTANAGICGTATAGDYGTASAGYGGTASAGTCGTASAGYGGTASAGYYGTASSGYKGTASSGYKGTIQIKWWDEKNNRYRITTGYVGENGIKANTAYVCNKKGELVEKS